jgi:uncharacterized membrane protein
VSALIATRAQARPDAHRRALPWSMIAATVSLLAAGFVLQLLLYGNGHTALSDIPRVALGRGIGPGNVPYLDRVLEYPVGAGLLLYVASLVAPGPLGTLAVTAVASSAVCVAITVALERRFGARAWRWALGAPLFLYAFQNWDAFAIGAMLVAVFAFDDRRDRMAGAAVGIGAAVKLFPGMLLAPLVAARLARRDGLGARRVAGWAVGAFALLNLPVLLASPSGWWWTYAFQGRRQATWGTIWFWLFRALSVPVHGAAGMHVANLVSSALLVGGVAWITVRAARRGLGGAEIAVASVAVALLANKVYSPTYDLWLLPAFVLLPLSRRLCVAFCAVDLAVFVTVYGSFHGLVSAHDVSTVLPVLVAARAVVLVTVLVRATRLRPAARPVPSSSSVHPQPGAIAA